MARTKNLYFYGLVFCLSAIPALNYVLNHFYVHGAYYLDSAIFAHLFGESTSWPMREPPALGGKSYFETHFTPIFYLTSAFYQGLRGLGLELYNPVWSALMQGLIHGLLGLNALALLSFVKPAVQPRQKIYYGLISILAAYSGANLLCLTFPHAESFISVFFLSSFTALLLGHLKWSVSFFVLGLSCRQDAGLHYFGFYILISLAYILARPKNALSKDLRPILNFGACALLYSLIVLVLQRLLLNGEDHAFARVYAGQDFYGHLDLAFVKERLLGFFEHRAVIYVPFLLQIGMGIWLRNIFLLVGPLAVLPWMLLNIFAYADGAGKLLGHYAFPFMIMVFWPFIVYAMPHSRPFAKTFTQTNRLGLKPLAALSVLFVALAGTLSATHYNKPWGRLNFSWYGKVIETHRSLNKLLDANPNTFFGFEDSAASLVTDKITKEQFSAYIYFSKPAIDSFDAIVFYKWGGYAHTILRIAEDYGFPYSCNIEVGNFAVVSRKPQLEHCVPTGPYNQSVAYPSEKYFDLLAGWSYKEPLGRWTIGPRASLPALKFGLKDSICFTAEGFLPFPDSVIKVSLKGYRDSLARPEFVLTEKAPKGEYCLSLAGMDPGYPLRAELAIEGYNSQDRSTDLSEKRSVGLFVGRIWIENRDRNGIHAPHID